MNGRMVSLRNMLLTIADSYSDAVTAHGGRSLARVSTIVLNQGGFFHRLRSGKTCTLDSFEMLVRWFAEPENWPNKCIPESIELRLRSFEPDEIPVEAG